MNKSGQNESAKSVRRKRRMQGRTPYGVLRFRPRQLRFSEVIPAPALVLRYPQRPEPRQCLLSEVK